MTRGPASLSHTTAASAPQPAPRHAQPWPTCQPAPHASAGPLSPKPAQDRTISVARVCPSTDMLAPHVSTLSPLPFPLRATAAPEMTGEIAGIPSPLLPAAIPALLPLNLALVSPCLSHPAAARLASSRSRAHRHRAEALFHRGPAAPLQLHLYRPSNHIRGWIKSHVYTTE